jgi:hypothetical protein
MFRPFLLACAILAIACGDPSDSLPESGESPGALFRTVSFAPYGPITLGKPLTTLAPPGVPGRPGTVVLRGGPFGDADSIEVRIDQERRVTGFLFVYPTRKSFDDAVTSYKRSIVGEPTHVALGSSSGRVERFVWREPATEFELSRLRDRDDQLRVWAVLTDRVRP